MNQTQISTDNNERLVRVEENLKFLTATQAKMEVQMDTQTAELRRLSNILEQAKGAKYVVAGLWMGFGGAGVAVLWKILSLVGFKIGS